MRREVPQRVNVSPDPTKVQPLTVDIADLSQLARVEQLLNTPNCGVVNKGVAHHYHDVTRCRQFVQLIDLGYSGPQRLSDKYMLASQECFLRQLEVRTGGRCNNNSGNLRIRENRGDRIHRNGTRKNRFHESPSPPAPATNFPHTIPTPENHQPQPHHPPKT